MDKDDLSKQFENQIHRSFANVKTLLDATGVNAVSRNVRNDNRPNTVKRRLALVNSLVDRHRNSLNRSVIAKKRNFHLCNSYDNTPDCSSPTFLRRSIM